MVRKTEEGESNTTKQKMLVNIGEQRKEWLEAVAQSVPAGTVTEVIRSMIDAASVEDPESYAGRVTKWRVAAELSEIEREEAVLKERKNAIVRTLEGKGEPLLMNERG